MSNNISQSTDQTRIDTQQPSLSPEKNGRGRSVADGPILKVNELKKHYIDSTGIIDRIRSSPPSRVHAVDGVSFTVSRGDTVGIVGESGCGKSTLAETLVGLKKPTSGNATLFENDIHEWVDQNRKRFARNVQFVFQDPSSCLDPKMTLRELIREPLEVHDVGTREHQNNLVDKTITKVGLSVDQLDRYPGELSGGQRQRVGIARAIILEPQLLVLDEPTSALDVSVQAQILNLLQEIQADLELTTLIISHDISVIRYLCNKVLVMYLGKVAEIGRTENIFSNPAHPYTKTLLESVPKVGETDIEYEEVDPDIPSPRDPPEGCRFHTRCPAIIPPDKFNFEQSEWKSVFDYKLDLQSGKLSHEKLVSIADQQGIDKDKGSLTNLLQNRYEINGEISDSTAQQILTESFTDLIEGNTESAYQIIAEEFQSPCEQKSPSSSVVTDDHEAFCHLI